MPVPTHTYHHGNLRQALLDTAGEILETHGAQAISLRGLARELDVSHAAPAHHFRNKTELMAELAADGVKVSYGAVWAFFAREGITFKKRACMPANRTAPLWPAVWSRWG